MSKKHCSVNRVRRDGGKVITESVCKIGGSNITSRAVFTGDFRSNYSGTISTKYDPPMMGMREAKQTLKARWVGACKPGQRPGDVVMPGMGGRGAPGGFNMKDMMERFRR